MKNKLIITLLLSVSCFLMTSCNTTDPVENSKIIETSTESVETSSEIIEETVENTDSIEIENETTIATSEETNNETTIAEPDSEEANNETNNTSETNWIDFDNMQCNINGLDVILGKTTLQELIDAGVPFEEDDLENINNNLKANHTSEGFKIELGEYWSAQVFVGNFTDSGQVIKDLPIVEVYLPNKADQTQDILKFAFPLDITEEELLSNCGEPQEKDLRGLEDEYGLNEYEYSRESTKYFSDSKYIFEFSKGSIRYLTLSWLP